MGSLHELCCAQDNIFVNWGVYSKLKNHQGRLPLFIALEQKITWYDGVAMILKGNGAAIENIDPKTGLDSFMLAAIGSNSSLEIIYRLLLDHPAAINPYMM